MATVRGDPMTTIRRKKPAKRTSGKKPPTKKAERKPSFNEVLFRFGEHNAAVQGFLKPSILSALKTTDLALVQGYTATDQYDHRTAQIVQRVGAYIGVGTWRGKRVTRRFMNTLREYLRGQMALAPRYFAGLIYKDPKPPESE